MTRSRPITYLASAAVIPLSALAVAACGGGGAATAAPPATSAASPPPKPAAVTVSVADSANLGEILVDSQGHTLYLFKADSRTMSACSGACATAWPPLRSSGTPMAGTGAKASLLGTIKRSDGAPQVTYNGHPLYLFVNDQKPGETNGQGLTAFGAAWFAVSQAGNQAGGKASSSGRSATPAPQPPSTTPAPARPATTPAPAPPATTPATPPPAAKPAPPANSGIPQNGGGDHDSDNNGGPSDGDGSV